MRFPERARAVKGASAIHLPDCRARRDAYFALSAADRRELVLRIAQEGPGAIDAFVKEREAEGDSSIAQRVKRLKEELMRRAEELRERLAGGFAERAKAEEARYQAAFAELASERDAKAEKLRRLESSEARFLEEALRGSAVVNLILSAPPPEKLSLGARVRRFLFRLLAFLLAPLRWLLRAIFGAQRKPSKSITIASPVGGSLGVDVEARAGAAYLGSPELRRRVKERLRASPARERVRRAWERLLGREDYESIARRVAMEMIEEEARAKRGEYQREEKSLADELARISEEEERRRAELAGRLRDLAAQREMEAERLERELADLPERTVKEEILDELTTTGLLRERGGKLLPTLQFLDKFGALVYQDEARAGAGKGGASGAYAEGEGTFTRDPLRSHVELAHMDVVASVTRSRVRHPHVRHLTEDDVLVYREDREALQHVIIVLDRSGSMEENGRLDAAKRAALALAHAVRRENPRNRVDFIAMSTSVERIDAMGVWEAEPRGFTNTGGALRLARDLVKEARSERALVYLVTDGLPEAYTAPEKVPEGESRRPKLVDVAGHPDRARKFALEQAGALRDTPGFGSFVCLLLEPEDEMYVKAADDIARELSGRVVKLSPSELAGAMIRAYEGGAPPAVAARAR